MTTLAPIATEVPVTWQGERLDRLVGALSPVTEGGHQLSLCLSAALLHRGVAPEAVPSIVSEATARAGWTAPHPGHYHRNASDTVSRWASGDTVRADVPPTWVPVLDELTNTPSDTGPSLSDQQARLARALREAPPGLSVVRCPCGFGKTHTARQIAAERAAGGKRTTISVPTNELAQQIAADLRAAGVAVRRVFGPLSVPGPHGGHACAYHAAASALASGWQSVSWELCQGRKRAPCPHLETCPAAEGAEGPEDALVVVGNHSLLSRQVGLTGQTGLLVVDEPPDVLEDHVIDDGDLAEALEQAAWFKDGHLLEPAVVLARNWLVQAPLDAAHDLSEVDVECDPFLSRGYDLGELLKIAGTDDVATAARGAVPKHALAPVIQQHQVTASRLDPVAASRLGRASRVLTLLYRALTDPGVRVVVFEGFRSGVRRMSFVSVDRQLAAALYHEGSVVVTAADAHLYHQHFERTVSYDVPLVTLTAPDGARVRRVLLEHRRVNRRTKPSEASIREALDLAAAEGPLVALVTFQLWTKWARRVVTAWAEDRGALAPPVRHYGGLRGLDTWKAYDGLVTVGDPIPNLNAVSRTGAEDVEARAVDLARAELEQAHGRLRTIHRTTPCTIVHVGRLVALGWPETFEHHLPSVGGRPPREKVATTAELEELVKRGGGQRATARRVGVTPKTVRRWVRGEARPPPDVVASLRAHDAAGPARDV